MCAMNSAANILGLSLFVYIYVCARILAHAVRVRTRKCRQTTFTCLAMHSASTLTLFCDIFQIQPLMSKVKANPAAAATMRTIPGAKWIRWARALKAFFCCTWRLVIKVPRESLRFATRVARPENSSSSWECIREPVCCCCTQFGSTRRSLGSQLANLAVTFYYSPSSWSNR